MSNATCQIAPSVSDATQRLFDMLQYCRPHGSPTEHAFIDRFLLPYGVDADGFGNLWVEVGNAPILWSSHVDTCHRRGGMQHIDIDATGTIRLPHGASSNCLGADCTAGVWLMTEMIEAGVPGIYVFHRGEERGGIGSRYVATQEPERLAGLSAAIAFDRRGATSVITHQSGERCCSDAFARSLSAVLGLAHAPDPTGSFTDTANYTGHIGECTNLSVGYLHEHTPQETLDLSYLLRLRDAVVDVDFGQLLFERQPGERDLDCDDFADSFDDVCSWSRRSRTLYDLVRDHPAAVTDFLEMNGVSAAELEQFIEPDIPF